MDFMNYFVTDTINHLYLW